MNAVGSPGAGRLGTRMEGEARGSCVDRNSRERGTEEARLGLRCPWVVEPGAWRGAAGLWLLLAAPCTELHLRAVKGSDFRKRCKRSF